MERYTEILTDHFIDYIQNLPAARKFVLMEQVFLGMVVKDADRAEATFDSSPVPTDRIRSQLEHGTVLSLHGTDGSIVVFGAMVPLNQSVEKLDQGPLARAFQQSLQDPSVDRNTDSNISIEEVSDFVRADIVQRDDLDGWKPVILEIDHGDSSDWVLVNGTEVERSRVVEGYSKRLLDWSKRGWISLRTKILASKVLTDWASGLILGPAEEAQFNAIRGFMKGEEGGDLEASERTRARSLENLISPNPWQFALSSYLVFVQKGPDL